MDNKGTPRCPITAEPCAEKPECDFSEPLVGGYPAGLGKTPCAKWVTQKRADGIGVHAAAADILLEEKRS